MYRALYNYKGKDRGALPVRTGEQFTFIEQHDANWWKMRSQTGSVGLVPVCYLEPVHDDTVRESCSNFRIPGHFIYIQGNFKETIVSSHVSFVGALLKLNWQFDTRSSEP